MKNKILSISAIIVIFISFLPVMQASALVTDVELQAYHCADQSISGTWAQKQEGDCIDKDDSPQTIRIEGHWTGYTADIVLSYVQPLQAKLICLQGAGCEASHDIYYRIGATILNTSSIDFALLSSKGWKIYEGYNQPPPLDSTLEISTTTGTLFSAITYDGKISKEALNTSYLDSSDPWHVKLSLFPLGDHLSSGYIDWQYTVIMSLNPIDDDCMDNYMDVGGGTSQTIPATSSTGVTLAIDPLKTYKVTISGGPWRDGGAAPDRYDAAYSYNGTNWFAMGGIANQCASSGEQTGGGTTYSFILPQDVNLTSVRFRVNDTGGTWTNNTGSLTVTLTEVITLTNCKSQYSLTTGNPVASGTVQATSTGMIAASNLVTGIYYVVETTGGHWHNGSDPTDLYTLQARASGVNQPWEPLGTFSNSGCSAASGSYMQVYWQSNGDKLYLRANDAGGNFTDNTGSINYVIYETTYTRFPNVCEAQFILGDVVSTGTVGGNAKNGIPVTIPDTSVTEVTGGGDSSKLTRWLALDVIGGPWTDFHDLTQKYSADLGVGASGSVSWSSVDQFGAASCITRLDGLGHYRIFWEAPVSASYWFRAHDTDFGGNTGSIGYTLYKAAYTYVGDDLPPVSGTCDSDFTMNAKFWEHTIPGSFASGELITGYSAGEMIAITTEGGPWTNGGANAYDVAISDDNGVTWHTLWAYAGVSCYQSSDTNHWEVFLFTQVGKAYKIRVADNGGVFSDNGGSIVVKAYHAETSQDPWKPCSSNYTMRLVDMSGSVTSILFDIYNWFTSNFMNYVNIIPVQLENGTLVGSSALTTGKTYAVLTAAGPWYEFGSTTPYYSADISHNNGDTWSIISEGTGACTVKVGTNYYATYFTVAAGDLYRIRVHDEDGNLVDFASNTGSLGYLLFVATADTGDNNGTVPDWTLGCSIKCTRPTNILDVGGWLEYFRCQFTYYISWCPEHTSALGYLKSIFDKREPFGTIGEITGILDFTKNEIGAYDWETTGITDISASMTQGGESGIQTPLSIINGLQDTSPWLGGQLTYQESPTGGQSPTLTCTANITAVLGGSGSNLTKGFCFVNNILSNLGILTTIRVMIIILNALFFFEYLQFRWLHKLGI